MRTGLRGGRWAVSCAMLLFFGHTLWANTPESAIAASPALVVRRPATVTSEQRLPLVVQAERRAQAIAEHASSELFGGLARPGPTKHIRASCNTCGWGTIGLLIVGGIALVVIGVTALIIAIAN
jgi:hypothetical protein